MTKRLKVSSPYDGHLISEVDMDDAVQVENCSRNGVPIGKGPGQSFTC